MSEAVFKLEPALNKEVELELEGWEKLKVKYSIEVFSGVSYLSWKVSGTDHTFRIPAQIVYEKHGIDYSEHFQKTLEVFRIDFLDWKTQGFPEVWMQNYQNMFQHLIR